ncbi:hypothetical protein N0V88_004684 [Collariella sp. IMI 366227]|nr:hypothetical protein N0V88_004684 [Collariella sp. IMI 366227]
MGFKLSHLYAPPDVNPLTLKARSIPFFNPVDIYGRVFFFSWFGFMIAFWGWYTFTPLLTHTIKYDLHLSPAEVANSNIVSLCATLLNATGLYASRFFIGILGGSFVPCQVWSTGFFDRNIVGTANALTGGFGNAGGGVTYFVMPAVYDAVLGRGYTPGQAWRLTFIVPLAMAITTGVALIVLCPDTPTGKWSEGHLHTQNLNTSNQKHATSTNPIGSFGSELAINSILASYYTKNFPLLSQTAAANWAAMFGFLNFVTRSLGGVVSDLLYGYCRARNGEKEGWELKG